MVTISVYRMRGRIVSAPPDAYISHFQRTGYRVGYILKHVCEQRRTRRKGYQHTIFSTEYLVNEGGRTGSGFSEQMTSMWQTPLDPVRQSCGPFD